MGVAEDEEVASATGGSSVSEDVRERKWFFGEKDAPPSGPVSFQRMAAMWREEGSLTGASLVWSSGMSKQERVSRMPELLAALGPSAEEVRKERADVESEGIVRESPTKENAEEEEGQGEEPADAGAGAGAAVARRRPPPPPIGAVTAASSPGTSEGEGSPSPAVRSPGIFGAARASIFLDRLRSSLTRSGAPAAVSPGRGGALEVAGSPELDSDDGADRPAAGNVEEGVEDSSKPQAEVPGEEAEGKVEEENPGGVAPAPAEDAGATPGEGAVERQQSTPEGPVSVSVDIGEGGTDVEDDNEIFLMLEELAEEEAAEEEAAAEEAAAGKSEAVAAPAPPVARRALTIDVGKVGEAEGVAGSPDVAPAPGPEDAKKLDVDALEVEVNRVYKQNSDIIERLRSPEALTREGGGGWGDATPRALGTGGRISPRLQAASARLRDEELESAKGYTVMLEEECERLRGQNKALVEAISDASSTLRASHEGDDEHVGAELAGRLGPLEAMVGRYIKSETKISLVEALSSQRPGHGGVDRARLSGLEMKVAHLAELLEVMARELDESGSMLKDYEATRHRCRALEQQLDTLRSANRDLVKRSARSAATSARHASMMRSASTGRLSRPPTGDNPARGRPSSSFSSSADRGRSLTPSGLRRPTPPKLAFGRPVPPVPQRSASAERRRASTPSAPLSAGPGSRRSSTAPSPEPSASSNPPPSGDFYRPARIRTSITAGKERPQPLRRSHSTPRTLPPTRTEPRKAPSAAVKAEWHDKGLDKPLSPDMPAASAFSRVSSTRKPSPAAIVGHLDSMVDLLRARFKDNGLALTLGRVQDSVGSPKAGINADRVRNAGVLYNIGEGRAQRKVYLNIKDGKLVLKTGGGYVDFIDYLSRNARSLGIKPSASKGEREEQQEG